MENYNFIHLRYFVCMNKSYIILLISFIIAIAYFDMLDSCKKINQILSSMIKLDSQIKTEIDTTSTYRIKLVKN